MEVTRQNIRAYTKMLAEDVLKILDKPEHRRPEYSAAAAMQLRADVMKIVEKFARERRLAFKGCTLEDLAILAALKAITLRGV